MLALMYFYGNSDNLYSESEASSAERLLWPASIRTLREVPSAYVEKTLNTWMGEDMKWAP